jgi:hypothetical protein
MTSMCKRGALRFVSMVLLCAAPLHLLAATATDSGFDPKKTPHSIVVGPEMAPLLKNAQVAISKRDYAAAADWLAKTNGMSKTTDEQYVVDQLRAFLAAKAPELKRP